MVFTYHPELLEEIVKNNTIKLKEISEKKNGEFLSDGYVDAKTKLKFKCSEGHIFETTPHVVMSGSWCNICNKSISESVCRFIFESIFNMKFKSSWIKCNDHNLELDGYNDELKIAFEYNGYHHYKKNFFIQTDKELNHRKKLDNMKINYCKKIGINLIVIPYTIRHMDIEPYIKNELRMRNIKFNDNYIKIKEFINNYSYIREKTKKIEDYVSSRGGKIIDIGIGQALIECDKGHTWKFNTYMLNLETWCKKCFHEDQVGRMRSNDNKKVTIEYVRKICSENNISCLTDQIDRYLESTIQIECERNHVSEYVLSDLFFNINQNRKICKICLNDRQYKFIDDLKLNGISLHGKYTNRNKPTEWKCDNGHIFTDKSKNIIGRIRNNNKVCKLCN